MWVLHPFISTPIEFLITLIRYDKYYFIYNGKQWRDFVKVHTNCSASVRLMVVSCSQLTNTNVLHLVDLNDFLKTRNAYSLLLEQRAFINHVSHWMKPWAIILELASSPPVLSSVALKTSHCLHCCKNSLTYRTWPQCLWFQHKDVFSWSHEGTPLLINCWVSNQWVIDC